MTKDPTVCRGKKGKNPPRDHYWDGQVVYISDGTYAGSCSRCGGKVTLDSYTGTGPFPKTTLITDPALVGRIKNILYAQL